ncbi:protein of unknown function [Candidatus Nitrotoga arctica]|uniref:Uncharacterized protein n=1 Tax=Candidatus Nitrotoga arctica TaxID=453162 RepID=A0ABN8AQ08_9PROT|nr:protein of unknown function [Candidatus Nitrotoga arctica]
MLRQSTLLWRYAFLIEERLRRSFLQEGYNEKIATDVYFTNYFYQHGDGYCEFEYGHQG